MGQFLARNDGGDDGRLWKDIVEKVHEDADRLFKMIGEAYAVLSDADKVGYLLASYLCMFQLHILTFVYLEISDLLCYLKCMNNIFWENCFVCIM